MLEAVGWILLGGTCVAMIIGGLRRHEAARRGPWQLLAASMATLAVGDALHALGQHAPARVCYPAVFLLAAIGLVQFTRGGAQLFERNHVIDLIAFGCAAFLVAWSFGVGTNGLLDQISAATIVGDVLLTGLTIRLVWTRPNRSAILLLVGAAGSLASGLLALLTAHPIALIGEAILYVCWGLAARHPSMTQLTQPLPTHLDPARNRCATLLGTSVGIPPLVLFVEAVTGSVHDAVVIATTAAITLGLAITRLVDSANLSSRTLAREHSLRTASAALVSASDQPAVDHAVRAAIAQLMPPDAVRRVVFAADDRELITQGLSVEPPPGDICGPPTRSWWLDAPHADEATLVCPLWLEPLAVARPCGGALVLTGQRPALRAARDALDVLAGQAALALDRISLVEAVGRRDSDLYLRAVIRNTTDKMLVLDADQRIRYASPGLRELLDTQEVSPLATLHDFVHPDDHAQVSETLLAGGDGTLVCALSRPDETRVLVKVTYRDLRADRLVQGFVVTVDEVGSSPDPHDRIPHREHVSDLPAWVNRRSAQHRFRY